MRGCDCFVLQPTCAPANTHLMELLIMIDALRRSSARRITAVIPYYGYARQDRKVRPRLPITAKLVADLISTAGTDRVLCIDLHAGQIQGFFNIPVDNLFATPGAARRDPRPLRQPAAHDHLARRGRRRARARLRQAPRREPRDHRQAPRGRQRLAGDEHHRRREGAHLRDRRRHRRHRRHAHRGRARAQGRRRRGGVAAITHPVLSGPAIKRIASRRSASS